MLTLSDLTPDQYAAICNGCGAARGTPFGWLRPPQGHARRHCDEHDLAYWIGGDARARRAADWHLLRGLLGDATGRPWQQRPGFRAKAILFWLAVRAGGWASWHYGAPRTVANLPHPSREAA